MTQTQKVESFVTSRTVNAPLDLVWKVWTEKDHLMKWFSPAGSTVVYNIMDFRPGGFMHYCLKTEDGTEMWGKSIYREIHPKTNVVWITTFSDKDGGLQTHPFAPTWPKEMLTAMTLTAEGEKTKVTIQWDPINATEEEIATFDSTRGGMNQGWSGTFGQLEAYLKDLQ
ncbi:MAG: SRPBCC domain-containing protein [bacterium]